MAKISKKEQMHLESHKTIEEKLSYILNEVSANGNPGLDNSLKDLYMGQKETHKKLDEIYNLVKPDLDKAAFWKQAKIIYEQSWVAKCFKTKIRAFISIFLILLFINIVIHPFYETSMLITAILLWIKKVTPSM